MTSQNSRRGFRKLIIKVAAIGTVLLVPMVALGMLGQSGLSQAIDAQSGLDHRAFIPMAEDKPILRNHKIYRDNNEEVEVRLNAWEFADNRYSKKK